MASTGPILLLAATMLSSALLSSGCGGSKKQIVVGGKSTTMQAVLGEIIAQHLEHRLGRTIRRNLTLGNTQEAYQALVNGEVSLYPEETGAIQAQILKEASASDASSTLERVRNEMKRISQLDVLDPLGIDNSWSVMVRKDQQANTLSEAADANPGWKLGVTRDFSARNDGLAALTAYRLPMGAMTKVSDSATLYTAFAAGELSMVVGKITDGVPARHEDWKALSDDKKVFPYYQTCVMVRADVLASDPKIQTALTELVGKFTNEAIRKMDAQVDVDHTKPADVAAEFLSQIGLK